VCPPGLPPTTRRRTLPICRCTNPILKTKEGKPLFEVVTGGTRRGEYVYLRRQRLDRPVSGGLEPNKETSPSGEQVLSGSARQRTSSIGEDTAPVRNPRGHSPTLGHRSVMLIDTHRLPRRHRVAVVSLPA
jgi:hypothetical protein